MKYVFYIFIINIFVLTCPIHAQTLLGGGGFGTPTETGPAENDMNKTVLNVFRSDNTGDIFSVTDDGIYCISGGDGSTPVKKVTDKVPAVGDVDPITDELCIVMPTGETYIYEPTGSCTFIEVQVANRALNSATAMSYHDEIIWHTNASNHMYQNNVDVGIVPTIVEMDQTEGGAVWFIDSDFNELNIFDSGTLPLLELPAGTTELDTYGVEVYVQTSSGEVFWFDNGGNWTSLGVLASYLEGFQMVNDNIVTGGTDIEIQLGIPTALPIKLASFEGKQIEDFIALTWQTQSEINNDKFYIEHSKNGNDWYEIGEVKGQGNSTSLNTYTIDHQNPNSGQNYYRLKQVDFDGSYEYSNTIAVNFDTHQNVHIYPNPVRDRLFVEFENQYENEGLILIYSPLGKLVKKEVLDDKRESIYLAGLQKGIFTLLINIKGQKIIKRFIKL